MRTNVPIQLPGAAAPDGSIVFDGSTHSRQGVVLPPSGGGGGGAGTTTLQDAYNNGGAGPQVIQVDPVRLGVRINDANPSIVSELFGVTDGLGTIFFNVDPSFGQISIGLPSVLPTADLLPVLGSPSVRFSGLFAPFANAGFSTALQLIGDVNGTGILLSNTGDGNTAAAGIFTQAFRFIVGSNNHSLLDLGDTAGDLGTILQGYAGNAAMGKLSFLSSGLTLARGAGNFLSGSFMPAAANSQVIGNQANSWLSMWSNNFISPSVLTAGSFRANGPVVYIDAHCFNAITDPGAILFQVSHALPLTVFSVGGGANEDNCTVGHSISSALFGGPGITDDGVNIQAAALDAGSTDECGRISATFKANAGGVTGSISVTFANAYAYPNGCSVTITPDTNFNGVFNDPNFQWFVTSTTIGWVFHFNSIFGVVADVPGVTFQYTVRGR